MIQPRKDESTRLQRLIEMLRDISVDPDPVTSVTRFRSTFSKLYGDRGMLSISRRGLDDGLYRVVRILHHTGIDQIKFPNVDFAGPHATVQSGGIIGEVIQDDLPKVIRDLNVEYDPVLGLHLSPYRMLLATPVFDGGRALNWLIFLGTKPDSFRTADIESQILQANLLGGMTNSKRAAKELLEATAYIHHEVDEIASIQRGLLPSPLPEVPGLQFAASHDSFDRAGGDYYDVFPVGLPDGADPASHQGVWGILIADASGHGPSAAVVVAMLSTLLHTRSVNVTTPGELLAYLNRHLASKPIHGSFVTAFMMFYDPSNRRAQYACAGHNPPMLKQKGEVSQLDAVGSFPLGIDPNSRYENAELQLESGDTVLLYTDGITELRTGLGDFFGEERLERILRESPPNPAAIIDSVKENLRIHLGLRPADDQTMMVAQVV
ncbi:MAG TPA: PP2C family protein-serine/threonine phosphatase [Candidatus Hydrogenedentes bacterium]|nr:PP2C family protein-serine/threonine phosphatase [Candidatus Hydrogenedentota bacterium]